MTITGVSLKPEDSQKSELSDDSNDSEKMTKQYNR